MEIQVVKREIIGKGVEKLREAGMIPAELYGHGIENIHLSVPAKEFSKLFKKAGESTIINLDLENKKLPVLIHGISVNHLTDQIIHIDFYQVRMDEKITASVPLEFIGEAPAIKEKGGILIKAVQEIEIEALPADLPHSIEVSLNELSDIGMSIRLKDLEIGEKVKVLINPETVVATVAEPVKEEVVEKPMTVEEIKVEGEEKKEEKQSEKSEQHPNPRNQSETTN
jgi:large subunit ribosomal protein L25